MSAERMHFRRGQGTPAPFVPAPQWVLLTTELSDAGYRIYSLLLAHVNAERDDDRAWPTQERIGKMLGRHRNSIGRVINNELVPLGLVDIQVERYGDNDSRRRNVYIVNSWPADGWSGVESVVEWHKENPFEEEKSAGRPGRTKSGASGDGKKTAGQSGRTISGASGRTESGASGRTTDGAGTYNNPQQEQSSSPSPLRGSAEEREEEEEIPSLTNDDTEDNPFFEEQYTGEREQPEPAPTEGPEGVVDGLPWPGARPPRGAARKGLIEAVGALLGDGWTGDQIQALFADTDWGSIKTPARFVLSQLNREIKEGCGGATGPEEEIAAVKEAMAQQKRDINACRKCDETGWEMDGHRAVAWCGHGDMSLKKKLWQLENPETYQDNLRRAERDRRGAA